MSQAEQMEKQYPLLEQINSPEDLRLLSPSELPGLAKEIRDFILHQVADSGGHLSSNLGVVELVIALHYVFDTPKDSILFDVSHQGYVHKLLTGRREFFKTLRQYQGCCGFLNRSESEFDDFGAGHAGTALSAALGIASANALHNSTAKVIAVVGDGALSCGITMEALNNAAEHGKRVILILNDNKMSIAENVGALRQHLNHLITGPRYNRFRDRATRFLRRLMPSKKAYRRLQKFEEWLKGLLLPSGFFETLGFRYIGPIHGHSFPELLRTFNGIKNYNRPIIVHVITQKGCGYAPAAAEPEKFHGIGAFDLKTGVPKKASGMTFSKAFGLSATELARRHSDVVAITAAMPNGTGLNEFAEHFPDRFFDVGIAEEHAVIFAAGLAIKGIRPIVAIYASFMQRALDCVFHDVCLQKLPVIFALDRSGVVEDGPTHHGIYDLSFLRSLPNLTIMAPKDEEELRLMLFYAYELQSPVVIRYPRGSGGAMPDGASENTSLAMGKAEIVCHGQDAALWAMGPEVRRAKEIAEFLKREYRIELTVVNARFIKPLDEILLQQEAMSMPVFTLEDHSIHGGLGTAIDEFLQKSHLPPAQKHFGWPDQIIPHGNIELLRQEFKLDWKCIAENIAAFFKQ